MTSFVDQTLQHMCSQLFVHHPCLSLPVFVQGHCALSSVHAGSQSLWGLGKALTQCHETIALFSLSVLGSNGWLDWHRRGGQVVKFQVRQHVDDNPEVRRLSVLLLAVRADAEQPNSSLSSSFADLLHGHVELPSIGRDALHGLGNGLITLAPTVTGYGLVTHGGS
jgi:hypothetical protein